MNKHVKAMKMHVRPAETGRSSAESERVKEEDKRKTAETGRSTAESTRVSAEDKRKTDEATRETNETPRVAAESNRVTVELERCRGSSTFETSRIRKKTRERLLKLPRYG